MFLGEVGPFRQVKKGHGELGGSGLYMASSARFARTDPKSNSEEDIFLLNGDAVPFLSYM